MAADATTPVFKDHFSAVAAEYAQARPEYPDALYAWIASIAPARGSVWEAGCGSGQATRDLARHFARVFATDPSAAQIAQASGPDNVTFAVEPGERCSLPDASVDAVCVAQALHWFDRDVFFAECARVLKPGGVLVAWGYRALRAPSPKAASVNNGHSAFCTTCDATPRLRPASTLPATTIKVCGTTAAAESTNGVASSGCLKT